VSAEEAIGTPDASIAAAPHWFMKTGASLLFAPWRQPFPAKALTVAVIKAVTLEKPAKLVSLNPT